MIRHQAVIVLGLASRVGRERKRFHMTNLVTYLAVAIPFVSIDLVWLKVMGGRLYRPTLGDILTSDPRIIPAAIFYAIYPLGLLAFAVVPAQHVGDALRAFLLGLMFGFFTYATYDLTN